MSALLGFIRPAILQVRFRTSPEPAFFHCPYLWIQGYFAYLLGCGKAQSPALAMSYLGAQWFFFLFLFCGVLEIELRAAGWLGKCSTLEDLQSFCF
jgi:hypothetical protein